MRAVRAIVVILCVVALAGCAAEPLDRDGDGVPNLVDAFPDDPSEAADTDGDGVGDTADPDADDDGVPDDADRAPRRDARLNLTLASLQLAGPVADQAEGVRVVVELALDGVPVLRFPPEGEYRVGVREPTHVNAEQSYDVNDTTERALVTLRAWTGAALDQPVDVDPTAPAKELTWSYSVSSGALAGDAISGRSSGRDDGDDGADAIVRFVLLAS